MILLTLVTLALTCHPQSRWMCDESCGDWQCTDPVCPLLCEPICDVDCVCLNPQTNFSFAKDCTVRCPPDQCEIDNCPVCETVCIPCPNGYQALCEAPVCSWHCEPDEDCPEPECEQTSAGECPEPCCKLQSEMPACSPGGRVSVF